ncbi:KTSC domain-containing protein [Desertivirga xinjiangensis]|uniref:KTSC domain-containing protein n=1 Tax=Desertivirga xinjiangensis TaxID=539206 RepID=UPI00210DDB34|nr:KTSC domain-containing protein [Pedobacter xinjiangensis]
MSKSFFLNNVKLSIDDRIADFRILSRKSSNVDYFGIQPEHKKLFVQFKNGKSYIYTEVPEDILNKAVEAESIGKFLNANITGKFISLKIDFKMVTEVKEEDVMQKFEYGAMSSKYQVTAKNKLTAYCAMILQYGSSAHLIALYSPNEIEGDSWLNLFGQISDRLDEIFGGEGSFDKYFEENIDEVKAAYNTIKQLV